jgi:hypothetical protein
MMNKKTIRVSMENAPKIPKNVLKNNDKINMKNINENLDPETYINNLNIILED